MSQMTKGLIGLVIILALALTVMTRINQSNVKEKERLKENQDALLSEIKFYRTTDSLSAASVQRITLSKGELREHRRDLLNIFDNLDIKVIRVKTASTTRIKSSSKIRTPIRDSIRILDPIPYTTKKRIDTLRCINYADKWLTISGCQENDEFIGMIESRNTIDQIVHRVPRKFLFFKWGTKAIRQEVVSRNPNSIIIFTEYLELKK